MSYCSFCSKLPVDHIHKVYHDTEYGVEEKNTNKLFERLSLEIFQAGLSWDIILKKRKSLETAFEQWNINVVSKYGENKIEQLMSNKNIIRHKLKINAIVFNAKAIIEIEQEHLSFHGWLLNFKGKRIEDCLSIFKKKFKFVGTEIVSEFLKGINIIDGAHDRHCTKLNLL